VLNDAVAYVTRAVDKQTILPNSHQTALE